MCVCVCACVCGVGAGCVYVKEMCVSVCILVGVVKPDVLTHVVAILLAAPMEIKPLYSEIFHAPDCIYHTKWIAPGKGLKLPSIWFPLKIISFSVSRFGLAIKCQAGKQRDLGSNQPRLSFLFKGCGL